MLAEINSPEQIKNLSQKELRALSEEIRRHIIDTVAHNGGHLASNLGVVELTLALHRSFSSPSDAIVWDVSHQCYAHKLLTGRYGDFASIRLGGGISGFTKGRESEHDFFDNGHASTSISQSLGLLKAREIQGVPGKVIAVIGDGALTGGLAYEGLLNAGKKIASRLGTIPSNLIIVLNDNGMSISPSEGSLSRYLSRLTMSIQYQSIRRGIDKIVEHLPLSRFLQKVIFRLKRGIKGFFLTNNLFVDLGFEYVGPLNGHDIREMEKIFTRVKKLKNPVIVHVVTKKGKGYSPAEDNPEMFHGIGPFNISDGSAEKFYGRSFTECFSKSIVRLAESNEKIVAITAAMSKGTGLAAFERKFPERFFDVGIAEEHAVTFAAGLAKGGMVPVVCIYSTFIQRSIDQIIHDIALPSLHAVLVLDRSGAVPNDGETHQGIFDIALIKNIPAINFLAPASGAELEMMLEYAAALDAPCVIRYPKKTSPSEMEEFLAPLQPGRGTLVRAEHFAPSLAVRFNLESGRIEDASWEDDGKKFRRVLLVTLGSMFSECVVASRSLLLQGVYVDIYNLRFVCPLDKDFFCETCARYDAVVIVEDGVKSGGVGEELEAALFRRKYFSAGVLAFAKKFPAQGSREEILEAAFLSPNDIQKEALGILNQLNFRGEQI